MIKPSDSSHFQVLLYSAQDFWLLHAQKQAPNLEKGTNMEGYTTFLPFLLSMAGALLQQRPMGLFQEYKGKFKKKVASLYIKSRYEDTKKSSAIWLKETERPLVGCCILYI